MKAIYESFEVFKTCKYFDLMIEKNISNQTSVVSRNT